MQRSRDWANGRDFANPARPTCSRGRCARAHELAKDVRLQQALESSSVDQSLQARHRRYLEVARRRSPCDRSRHRDQISQPNAQTRMSRFRPRCVNDSTTAPSRLSNPPCNKATELARLLKPQPITNFQIGDNGDRCREPSWLENIELRAKKAIKRGLLHSLW